MGGQGFRRKLARRADRLRPLCRSADFEPGRFITFRRNPDYWGRDLPFNRGQHNFDEIRYDYFGDGDVVFEAFTAGETTSSAKPMRRNGPASYDFPAIQSGDVVKSEIPQSTPLGHHRARHEHPQPASSPTGGCARR